MLDSNEGTIGSEPASQTAPPTPEAESIPAEVLQRLRNDPKSLDALVADLPDEVITKVPNYERRMAGYIEKKQRELREANERELAKAKESHNQLVEAQRFVGQVEAMSPDQWGKLTREQPEYAAQYATAKKLVATQGAPSELAIADRIWTKARAAIEAKFGVDLGNAATLEEAVEVAAESLTSKQTKELEASFEKKLEAVRTELSGKLLRQTDQPERGASNGAASGGKRTFTHAEVDRVLHDRNEWKKYGSEVELAIKEGRIK